MKYGVLVWAGLWRRPATTILTMLSIAAAFVVFGFLHGVNDGFDDVVTNLKLTGGRIRVMNSGSFTDPLPLAHVRRIAQLPGVAAVTPVGSLGAFFQDPKQGVGGVATDAEALLRINDDMRLSEDAKRHWLQSRTALLVGARVAERFGWRVGDRISLQSTTWQRKDGSSAWPFEIAGIYEMENPALARDVWLRFDYFDEARAFWNSTTSMIMVRTTPDASPSAVSREIDSAFANSSHATLSQDDKQFIQSRLHQLGDIELIVALVSASVFYSLLLLTGNAMVQSFNNRTAEIAVLKAIGYRDSSVLLLVFAESLLLCGLGAGVGLWSAALLLPSLTQTVGGLALPTSVFVKGFVTAIALAAVAALLPMWRARALTVAAALHRR